MHAVRGETLPHRACVLSLPAPPWGWGRRTEPEEANLIFTPPTALLGVRSPRPEYLLSASEACALQGRLIQQGQRAALAQVLALRESISALSQRAFDRAFKYVLPAGSGASTRGESRSAGRRTGAGSGTSSVEEGEGRSRRRPQTDGASEVSEAMLVPRTWKRHDNIERYYRTARDAVGCSRIAFLPLLLLPAG